MKHEKLSPTFTPDARGAIAVRRAELRQLDKDLLTRILDLERLGTRDSDAARDRDLAARVRRLLGEAEAPTRLEDISVAELQRERKAIDKALELLDQRDGQLAGAAASAALIARGAEWRGLVRERAEAVCRLQRVNRACEEFRQSFVSAGLGQPALPCNGTPKQLLGVGTVGDEIYVFLQAAVKAQIVTPGEIEKWKAPK